MVAFLLRPLSRIRPCPHRWPCQNTGNNNPRLSDNLVGCRHSRRFTIDKKSPKTKKQSSIPHNHGQTTSSSSSSSRITAMKRRRKGSVQVIGSNITGSGGGNVDTRRNSNAGKQATKKMEEVRDGQGVTVLSPGLEISSSSGVLVPSYRTTHHRGTRQLSHKLPILNASCLLDSKAYCIQSATASHSNSGTDAARRLLRGKRDFIATVRQHVLLSCNNNNSSSSQLQQQPWLFPGAFLLQHHGVPVQLLQDHVNLANTLLLQEGDAPYISLQQYDYQDNNSSSSSSSRNHNNRHSGGGGGNNNSRSNSATAATEINNHRWIMRVRSRDGQKNRATPLVSGADRKKKHMMMYEDVDDNDDIHNSMELYLTVMNRMANALAVVLHHHHRQPHQQESDINDNNNRSPYETDDDDFRAIDPRATAASRDRNSTRRTISFERGLEYPSQVAPPLTPIVEWHPQSGNGNTGGGQLTIHVQGTSSSNDFPLTSTMRRRKALPVTLSYAASFPGIPP